MIKVSVLNENTAGRRGFLAEHGLSLLLETDRGRFLFDTGQTDVFIKNAEKLGEDLLDLDGLILSHGHFDHCGGLYYLAKSYRESGKALPPVYVRRAAFLDKRAINADHATYRMIGIPWKRQVAGNSVHLTKDKEQIGDGMWVLGNIPYTDGLEKRPEVFFIDNGTEMIPDYMEDEQLLAVDTEKGLCVFAGCCHAGILNCLAHVKRSFPERPIYSVFAGMHLVNADEERIQATIEALSAMEVSILIPAHCTGIAAIGAMKASFGQRCRLVETGAVFEIK